MTSRLSDSNVLFQYSTASALMAGVGSHGLKLSGLLSHGDHGLGTVALMNGELIILDGTGYLLEASGGITVVDKDTELPFAMITKLDPTKRASRPIQSKGAVLDVLSDLFSEGTNRFMCFRIQGTFKTITSRVAGGQQYELQPLSELADKQKVSTFDNATGVMVGFWSPSFMHGVSVAGLHMHFLSEDRKFGGHVLSFEASEAVDIGAAIMSQFQLELPSNAQFNNADLNTDAAALSKIEG